MRAYDLVLVLRAGLSETERKKVPANIKSWLGEAKVDTKELGKKSLAYPIKKEREGIYVLASIVISNGSTIGQDLGKKLRSNEDVLRYLLVRRKATKKNGGKKS